METDENANTGIKYPILHSYKCEVPFSSVCVCLSVCPSQPVPTVAKNICLFFRYTPSVVFFLFIPIVVSV